MSQTLETRLKKLLCRAFDALPDGPHKWLTTIKGIGPGTAAALVAKVVLIERFATPAQLVSYFGVFPEQNTSGYDRRGRPVSPGTMEPQTAVGHKEDGPPEKVVTTASPSVEAHAARVNVPRPPGRRRIDYAALRRQVTMEQVLSHLGWLPQLTGRGRQRRGPCPLHGQPSDGQRSFSVELDKHVFRCFHAECSAQGNVLDLWAAVQQLPLYEAAVQLAQTFALELPLNREEEPVRPPSKPR